MSENHNNCIERPQVQNFNQILGQRFNVLDDGFVRVIDYMGNDAAVVQAARVSYGAGTKKIHEDRGLIRYLLRHWHTTPFEMCEIKLHLRVPMDAWRQWIRHRTASVNEYSTRYSVAINAAQRTQPSQWRLQTTTNRQGAEGFIEEAQGITLTEREAECQGLAQEVYEERLQLGIAREQARKDLPLSTYTEAYWKIDLNNLLHFLRLRMDSHAQAEIRAYAHVIGNIVKQWCPLTWEAFEDYQIGSVQLGRVDQLIIALAAQGKRTECIRAAIAEGLLTLTDGTTIRVARELQELEQKLTQFSLEVPWHDESLTKDLLSA
jgi:thymidylate synthase (FAD)